MTIRAAFVVCCLVLPSLPAQAGTPACADLPTQEQVETCVFDRLQDSGAKLSAAIAQLGEDAKEFDKKSGKEDSLHDKLNQANLRFNAYLQGMCDYLASRHTDEKDFAAAYNSCNQKMIDQRLELITTETAK